METKYRGNVVAWLALVIAIVGLVLAWRAYNRTGAPPVVSPNVSDQAAQQLDRFARETRLRIGQLEVNANLNDVRESLNRQDYDSALTNLSQAKTDLLQAYEGSDIQADQEIQRISNQFNQLEQQVRARSRDAALRTLETVRQAVNQRLDRDRGNTSN